jgi:hypothetical protein
MTTPLGKTYYFDFKNSPGAGQTPGSRCPRVLDIYMSGPRGCGYIYTPSLYRSQLNGTTLALMISAQTGIDITKTGSTGIMVAYKLGPDGNQERVGNLLTGTNRILLTTDNTKGLTLSVGSAIAIGVSFGSGVTVDTAYTFYLVNLTGGNTGELIWRMQYIVNQSLTGWFQYGVHQSNWPSFSSNSDNLGPPLLYSYGASISGEDGKTGYSGPYPPNGTGYLNYPGSAQFRPYKINEIKT